MASRASSAVIRFCRCARRKVLITSNLVVISARRFLLGFVRPPAKSGDQKTGVLLALGRQPLQCLSPCLQYPSLVATGYDPLLDNEPELSRPLAASVMQRIAFGERAGQNVRCIGAGFGDAEEHPALTGPRCVDVNGFALHANTQISAHRRDQLERLMRYTGRGAVLLERLAEDANGDLLYAFTRPWSDGTTGIKLSPLELSELVQVFRLVIPGVNSRMTL
jgi:Putative transposase